MLMTDETFLASILLNIPFIRMFQKLGVTHLDQQPHQPTPGPALSTKLPTDQLLRITGPDQRNTKSDLPGQL